MKFFDVDQTFIKLEVMDILVPESLHYLTNKKIPQLNRPKLDRVPQGAFFEVFGLYLEDFKGREPSPPLFSTI